MSILSAIHDSIPGAISVWHDGTAYKVDLDGPVRDVTPAEEAAAQALITEKADKVVEVSNAVTAIAAASDRMQEINDTAATATNEELRTAVADMALVCKRLIRVVAKELM